MHRSLQIMFIWPLTTGHLLMKAIILGGLYTGVALNVGPPPPEQNDRNFAYDIFKSISGNENFLFLIKISLKFVPSGPIDKDPVLV